MCSRGLAVLATIALFACGGRTPLEGVTDRPSTADGPGGLDAFPAPDATPSADVAWRDRGLMGDGGLPDAIPSSDSGPHPDVNPPGDTSPGDATPPPDEPVPPPDLPGPACPQAPGPAVSGLNDSHLPIQHAIDGRVGYYGSMVGDGQDVLFADTSATNLGPVVTVYRVAPSGATITAVQSFTNSRHPRLGVAGPGRFGLLRHQAEIQRLVFTELDGQGATVSEQVIEVGLGKGIGQGPLPARPVHNGRSWAVGVVSEEGGWVATLDDTGVTERLFLAPAAHMDLAADATSGDIFAVVMPDDPAAPADGMPALYRIPPSGSGIPLALDSPGGSPLPRVLLVAGITDLYFPSHNQLLLGGLFELEPVPGVFFGAFTSTYDGVQWAGSGALPQQALGLPQATGTTQPIAPGAPSCALAAATTTADGQNAYYQIDHQLADGTILSSPSLFAAGGSAAYVASGRCGYLLAARLGSAPGVLETHLVSFEGP
jgi:hypothetical protein